MPDAVEGREFLGAEDPSGAPMFSCLVDSPARPGRCHPPVGTGFLQRSTEHANDSHQEDLRRAISAITDTRLADVVGVTLRDLLSHRVDVEWVDTTGSHRSVLTFPYRARTQAELGELLRQSLHRSCADTP